MPDEVRKTLSKSMSKSSLASRDKYLGRWTGHGKTTKKKRKNPAATFERGKKNPEGKIIHPVVQVCARCGRRACRAAARLPRRSCRAAPAAPLRLPRSPPPRRYAPTPRATLPQRSRAPTLTPSPSSHRS